MLRTTVVICAAALLSTVSLAHAQDGARRDEGTNEVEVPAPTLTKAPALLEAAAPVYPQEALDAGLEATVPVRIHIDETGIVTLVEVIEPVGKGFDEAAVEAAELYVFSPAEFDGTPGPIVVETNIHFTIEVQEEEPPPPPPPPASEEDEAAALGPPSHGGDARLPVTISGQAVERGSRRALAGVIVALAELGVDAITDEDGNFYFHGVPAGTYRVIAVEDRYDRLERSLELTADERVEVRLWMRAKGGNPYETIVEGEREVLEVTKRTLERRQLTTVPGTFGDPIRVIQALPGMALSPFGTGLLLVRGSNPDDSAVFIDGHRVPLIFHFLGGPSILNAEFLESIDLYPGGYPARFGRALGGVVAVETRSSESDGVHGSADIDIFDAGAYLRMPVGDKGSFAIAGRRSYLNLVLDQVIPRAAPGAAVVVVPVYYDYQMRFDYDLGAEGSVSLFWLASSDRLDVVAVDDETEQSLDLSTSIAFSRLIGTYRRPIGGGLRLTMSPMYGRDRVRFSGGQAESDAAFTGADIIMDTLGYRMRVDGRVNDLLVVDLGIDLESRVTRYDLLIPLFTDVPQQPGGPSQLPPEDFEQSVDFFAYGLHADLGWDATDKLKLVPGLRFDGYWLAGEVRKTIDPRISGRYQINDAWTAKGYVGLFHQPPQPETVDSLVGNPDLTLERALHTGLGGEWVPAKAWKVDAEVYYVDRYDQAAFNDAGDRIVTEDPRTGEVRVTPVLLENTAASYTTGFELMVQREVTQNLYGWLAYTLSYSRNRERPEDPETPTFFDQRHVLNAVASYRFDNGWEIGGRFRLGTGRPITPIDSGTFIGDETDYDPYPGEMLSERRKTFHQLDLRAEKTWTFNYFTMAAYLDIQNVFNVTNEEGVQRDYRFRREAPVQSIPILPTLGVRGQW
ncbi:TonB-dependent receptor domain-containing protein [Haliangium ochraceum]|uniref:TonB family protein n=1 Tax=Haliangium ochraceum (strain DSM 14365 / JCM 11303 / SMP-2) TaxID=502025 RepID=D0LJ23_HALO1|nr:TonB-dependent receptor [Haliangium ochraceum]ACY13052.1 TonB family protein [Haliangium ochraceum DSM 14365]